MIKNVGVFFLLFFALSFLNLPSHQSHAAMNPKVKVVLNMAGYGAAGGALLGFATMAFGADKIAVAQGASLGLYAGIIFGAYVVLSHPGPGRGRNYDNGDSYQSHPDDSGDEGPPMEETRLRLQLEERPLWQVESNKRLEQFGALSTEAKTIRFNLVTVSF